MMESVQRGEDEDEDDNTTQTCDNSLVVQTEDKYPNQKTMVLIEGLRITTISQNDDAATILIESVISNVDEIERTNFST